MQKKYYSTPEVDIEKFSFFCHITTSGDLDNGGNNEGFVGGNDGDEF